MADYINNVAAGDKYTDACSVGPNYEAKYAVVTIANNSALMQFAIGKPGNYRWTDEREFQSIAQSFRVGNVIGVRVRNAAPGQVARVLVVLAGDDDPDFSAGMPFNGTLSASGTVTPVAGTVIEYVTVLPAAPVDGETVAWVVNSVNYPGVIWFVRWNATAGYWEVLGGDPIYSRQAGANSNGGSLNVWVNVSSSGLLIPRAGDYKVRLKVRGQIGAGGAGTMNVAVSKVAGGPVPITLADTLTQEASFSGGLNVIDRIDALAANDALETVVNCNQANCNFDQIWLEVTPIRIQ